MARKTTKSTTTIRTKKSAAAFSKAAALEARLVASPIGLDPISLEEEIRLRAYQIYLERGSTPGDAREDWFLAERQIRERHHPAQGA